MKSLSDTEVKQKGIPALIETLGEVDAERFILLINRELFDYTTWQREIFKRMSVHDISNKAMSLRKKR